VESFLTKKFSSKKFCPPVKPVVLLLKTLMKPLQEVVVAQANSAFMATWV